MNVFHNQRMKNQSGETEVQIGEKIRLYGPLRNIWNPRRDSSLNLCRISKAQEGNSDTNFVQVQDLQTPGGDPDIYITGRQRQKLRIEFETKILYKMPLPLKTKMMRESILGTLWQGVSHRAPSTNEGYDQEGSSQTQVGKVQLYNPNTRSRRHSNFLLVRLKPLEGSNSSSTAGA